MRGMRKIKFEHGGSLLILLEVDETALARHFALKLLKRKKATMAHGAVKATSLTDDATSGCLAIPFREK